MENVATPTASSRKACRRRKASVSPPRICVVAFPRPRDSNVGTAKSLSGPATVSIWYQISASSSLPTHLQSVHVDLTETIKLFIVHDLPVHVQAIQLCKRSFHGITTARFILYRFIRTVRPSWIFVLDLLQRLRVSTGGIDRSISRIGQ